MRKDYYLYVYLNQTIKGEWLYEGISMNYQPFYIGKGTKKRDASHLTASSLSRKSMKNSTIKNIIKKTGENPIHIKLFENISEEEAICREKDFIKVFGRKDLKEGILTNCTNGGDGAHNLSESSRLAIGVKNKKKVYQYSLEGAFIKKWDYLGETKKIIDNPANISTSIKRGGSCGGFIWSYDFLGDNIVGKKKYQMPVKFTNIKQLDKDTGEFIKLFSTALEAETKLNLRKGARNKICECINNKLKTAYGYNWEV